MYSWSGWTSSTWNYCKRCRRQSTAISTPRCHWPRCAMKLRISTFSRLPIALQSECRQCPAGPRAWPASSTSPAPSSPPCSPSAWICPVPGLPVCSGASTSTGAGSNSKRSPPTSCRPSAPSTRSTTTLTAKSICCHRSGSSRSSHSAPTSLLRSTTSASSRKSCSRAGSRRRS